MALTALVVVVALASHDVLKASFQPTIFVRIFFCSKAIENEFGEDDNYTLCVK